MPQNIQNNNDNNVNNNTITKNYDNWAYNDNNYIIIAVIIFLI